MPTGPQVEIAEFSIDTDPQYHRQDSSGHGFVKVLNTSAGGTLLFSPLNITVSGGITESHVVLARVTDFGDASGVYNMKFYLSSISAWTTGTYRFLQKISSTFLPNYQVSEADNDTPTSIPGTSNYLPASGQHAMSGIFDDDVGQYIYLGVLAEEDVDIGIHGGAGVGSFRYRLLYDYS